MSLLGKLLFLCLTALYGGMCQRHEDQHQAMFLAGPMTSDQVKGLDVLEGELLDTFDCSHPIPPGSRQHFEHLQSRGVTHFKVPLSWAQLLPTGLPSQPHQAAVTCYQTLLRQLLDSGLQPLVVLHGSTVPEALRSRYGGWESQELGDMFQQYAEFVFGEFGELGDSWVTLSSLDELTGAELQSALDAHSRIYGRYHQMFPGRDGQVSVGVKGSKIPIICETQQQKYFDFLSVKVQYDCTAGENLAEELKNVMEKCGKKPVLVYELNIHGCSPYRFLSDTKLLEVMSNGEQNVLGLDMVDLLHPADSVLKRQHQGEESYNRDDLLSSSCLKTYCKTWSHFATMTSAQRDAFLSESFPAGFQWATSSEAFKVEATWLHSLVIDGQL